VAWTLIHEVYFYWVVSFALILSLRGRIVFGVSWFGVVLTGFCAMGQNDFGGNRVCQLIFSPFSLTFILGFFVGLWRTKHLTGHVGIGLLFVLLAICGVGFAYLFQLPETVYPNNSSLTRFLVYCIPCASLVMGAALLEQATRQHFGSLRHLGNESYAIYLPHVPILTVIYKSVSVTHCTNIVFLFGVMVVSLFTCIALAAIFHRHIEMPIIRRTREYLEVRFGLIEIPSPLIA
jgi:peptidoglycan/LPS O-acetylase OafA/YrhL